MAAIVMADDGIVFDGDTLSSGPLGGAETAFVSLAEALAARGHDVSIFNRCAAPMERNGVRWRQLEDGLPGSADLFIANRSNQLLPGVPGARRRIFWIHNPARYLLKWRYLSKLWRWRPTIVFSGTFHAASYPAWAPAGGREIIPYGISDAFRTASDLEAPPAPRVAFTSSPLRSLDWLLDIWARAIRPAVPNAELHLYSSPRTYGAHGDANATAMNAVLERASELGNSGVVLCDPLPKDDLAREIAGYRALLYRGDPGETFCLAIGESQAAGVPCVVQDIGCVAERLIDGTTGFVAVDDQDFATRAISLLSDDTLWQRQHDAARARQRGWGWDDAAAAFEKMIPA